MPAFRVISDPLTLVSKADRLRELGSEVVDDVSAASAGTVYVAEVTDREQAQQAVLAALRGADLLIACTAEDDVADELVEDLQRLGTLRYDAAPGVVLPGDQVELLRRLHAGASLGAAAASLHLSRRTADRRLALARAGLGARTTAEALVEAARLGILDESSD